jgi:methyltransferase
MWLNITVLSLVTLQRLVELYIARRNTRKLLERGGFELGSNHYPFIVALHALWLAGLWYLVIYWQPVLLLPWIFAYLVLEAARGWVIAALGSRWTTRIIVVPGETLVDNGPYKYFKHPNYMVVAGEIFILPMAFGLWWYAAIFGLLNLAVLWWRIRTEDKALDQLREPPTAAAVQPPESSPEP